MKKIIVLFIIGYFLNYFLLSEVKNPDKPLNGDWDLKPQKVWEISEYGKNPVANPAFISVQDDGTLCIFDFGYALNYIFDGKGKLITPFGKRGEGPGEVRIVFGSHAVNDKFIITDRGKFHFFLKNGKYEKSITTRIRTFFISVFFINGNECIFIPPRSGENFKGHGDITYLNLKTMEKKIIKKGNVLNRESISRVLTPMTIAGFDHQNKKLYYGVNNIYQINVIDIKGKSINSFSLERKKRTLTYDLKKKFLKEFYRGSGNVNINQKMKILPDEVTYFSNIQIENGLVFLYVNYLENYVDEQQIDMFSLDGKYLYKTKFKVKGEGKILPNNTLIKNEYLYAVIEDEEENVKLIKYKISLPKTK